MTGWIVGGLIVLGIFSLIVTVPCLIVGGRSDRNNFEE